MPFQAPAEGVLLPPYRVLDLTGPEGVFCGKLLADYGAEVIKVEPPTGDVTRQRPPFISDVPGIERSSYFLFYNTNKKSVTIDLETSEGQVVFKKLAASADVLIESFPVNYMQSLGLDYDSLRQVNPGLIMASITPFGQTGPWKDYKSTDLISLAASGFMQITGDPDGPPLRQGNEQSHFPGAQHAATAIMGALFYRDMQDGRGQYIDVSMQEAMITYYTDAHPALAYIQRGENVTRVGTNSTLVIPLGAYPSKDGWISAGIITPREWENLSNWMFEVTGNEEILNEDYKGGNQDRAPYNDIITALVIDFTTRFTSEELFHQGQERNLVFIPVNTVSDLLVDPQLDASNFWFDIDHADAGNLKYPLGVFDSEEVTPTTNPAPYLGQDNEVIFGELGLDEAELASLRTRGVI
ncbi:MAG: CoA transferase [Chloroflexota bacterium]|mgnify:FL=1|jgi:crotonobetainyl-CoA:carnitine CoA-transferase CaiB-like acyl-CoA transferase|nr:MAG: CoA transferase [SAR202 cluster bacterium]MEC9014819.1 CoA transferase [Chloroflexota bacterium]|tara:strand:+ start:2507 stop:3739 length:1233 start_codon:yes stop_codon:yes gene_type:complete